MTGTEELAGQVALASRILAAAGLAREATGHVSARTGAGRMLLRCRDDREPGLRFTERAVAEIDFDAPATQAPDGMRLPIERHIHGQLLAARPEINAVVHVHPWSTWLTGIAGIPLAPVLGAFDPGALACAVNPPPVYPQSWLINSAARGADIAALMDGHDACVLRGHGIVTVGASVEQATVRALRLNTIAMASAMAHLAGSTYRLGEDEIAELVTADPAVIAAAEHEVWLHYAEFAAQTPAPTGFLPFLY
ncbi:class II aldolase/adducin family protein [Dactylosporangium sp. CA-092794]|uniref:class II aldolase/adducin family protein n=1 Tax=Dactylosporangium sp. CA-092794 TaxID=3239929 RepID=UPI003D8F6E40